MTRPCYLLIVLLICSVANAQSRFQLAFGPPVTTGSYGIGSVIRHTNNSWTLHAGVTDLTTLLHLGATGAPQWNTSYHSAQLTTLTGISAIAAGLSNSTIVIFRDTLLASGAGTSLRHFGLARISSTGEVIWSKRYRFEVPSAPVFATFKHELAVATDGRIFVHTGEPDISGIMCFQPTGAPLWSRKLTDPDGVGGMRSLVPDEAGGCSFLGGVAPSLDTSTVIVGHLNANGSLSWKWKFTSSVPGRLFEPTHMIRTQDGGLLISLRSFDPSAGTNAVLIRLSATGGQLWANTYRSDLDGFLDPFAVGVRPDGRFWLGVGSSGYGMVGLDARGQVQQAERYMVRQVDNSTHLVELRELFVHENDLCIVATYYIDQSWTGNDPRTQMLWKVDVNEPALCTTDPLLVTSVPENSLMISSTTVGSNFFISELPFTLSTSMATAPPTVPFCPMYVGVDELAATPVLHVAPSLIEAGAFFTVRASEPVLLQLIAANGKLRISDLPVPPNAPVSIATSGLAPGLYLVRAMRMDGRPVGTARLVIQ